MDSKAQHERYLLDDLTRLRPEIELSDIRQPAPPAPDFLARFRNKTVGIEITRQLRSDQRKGENEEAATLRLAVNQYSAKGLPNIGLFALWSLGQDRSRAERALIASTLADFAARNVPQEDESLTFDWDTLPEPLKTCLHTLRIDRLHDYPENHWRSPMTGWVPKITDAEIRSTIQKKNSLVQGYRCFCDEVWLLIASENRPSSWFEYSPEVLEVPFQTQFDRLFFTFSFPLTIVELQTR